ncbi:polar amino acid transport system substrate-binding protein [Natronobacillus azotifigens]|uniref:ABC transporter substrate-binding protein n=1 Tax=Natronobacillus azotifigens TaxID=472978 RepID=A0A9J6R917_9BACI|nr:ABC transporter substrate-binding protein [Natronobacillus azotifigens]MCZ0701756.1 ABC transporter substrate-binding protein [Natronobacillus azotifigens]
MKKIVLLMMLIGLFTLGLVACGTTDNDVTEPSDENTEVNNENTQADNDASNDDGEPEERDTLIMATSADYPPFEFRDTSGEIVGFDIALAYYIAGELGYELEIRDMDFNGLIGALQNNRVDMVISGMSATESRRENVDFSTEYHHSAEMFITQQGSDITSIEDFNGKRIGVQLGSIQEEGAEALKEQYDIEIHAVDQATTLIQELNTNRIDIAYMDKSAALGFIESQNLAGFDDPTSNSPGMAVAFPKGSDLVERVNAAIASAEESGYLQELRDEWLSEED